MQSNLISVSCSPSFWCIVAETPPISMETLSLPFGVIKSGACQDPLTSSGTVQDVVLLRAWMKEIKLLIYVAEIWNTLPDRRNPHTVKRKGPFWPQKWGQNFDPRTAPMKWGLFGPFKKGPNLAPLLEPFWPHIVGPI